MYYEYWKLQKPPFDNVPDPSMYVDSHVSLESAIAETLFAIEEGNECLSVIVGDVGLGKTLSLRLIIDSLDQEKYRIALVTNPGISFIQLLREIIGQITGTQCRERKKADLLEAFNKILFETADQGKKVLVFIDEANAISPADLERLRLLTNMQDDRSNLFTIVLAGQMELAKRLENPKRANLFQRIGTFSRIERIPSEDVVQTYIETRLRLAGGTSRIFTDDAAAFLWEYSDHGVPRLINKIAKLCLKAGETNGFERIDGETVRLIGERFRNLTGEGVQKKKKRRIEINVSPVEDGEAQPESIQAQAPLSSEAVSQAAAPEEIAADSLEPIGPAETVPEESVMNEPVPETRARIFSIVPEMPVMIEAPQPSPTEETEAAPQDAAAEEVVAEHSGTESFVVQGIEIQIEIPPETLQNAPYLNHEQKLRSAGFLAAQALRSNPDLTAHPASDPIMVWSEIRNIMLKRLEGEEKAGLPMAQASGV